jgi:hypothetical protein
MPRRPVLIFAAIMLLIAAVIGGYAYMSRGPHQQQGSGVALVGGPFSLIDQDGRRVTEKDFLGKYMLVFFGYTYCPDICPTELQVMSAALDQMGPEAGRIQPIFVSIDPARRKDADARAELQQHRGNDEGEELRGGEVPGVGAEAGAVDENPAAGDADLPDLGPRPEAALDGILGGAAGGAGGPVPEAGGRDGERHIRNLDTPRAGQPAGQAEAAERGAGAAGGAAEADDGEAAARGEARPVDQPQHPEDRED